MKILLLAALLMFTFPQSSNQTSLEVVAAVIAGEARGEGEEGMRAVAEVIRNRGGTLFVTVTKRKQFSCLNDVSPEELVGQMRNEQGWETALALSDALHRGTLRTDTVNGANHYHESKITPYWARDKKYTVWIGRHLFYKL